MTEIKKMLLWGGNCKPLQKANLDSHASVSAFFLSKYLQRGFDIRNIVDMGCPEELLNYCDVDIMLTTFQYGFTSRILQKNKNAIYRELRKKFHGPLAAILDRFSPQIYTEDFLFTVLPPPIGVLKPILTRKCPNPSIDISRMGWCADPNECFPDEKDADKVTIF